MISVIFQQKTQKQLAPGYTEPPWSAKPLLDITFTLDVIKNGVQLDLIDLNEHAWYMVGRMPPENEAANFILMEHPSLSRQHAVFQHENNGTLHLYDLGSTHGTYLN